MLARALYLLVLVLGAWLLGPAVHHNVRRAPRILRRAS